MTFVILSGLHSRNTKRLQGVAHLPEAGMKALLIFTLLCGTSIAQQQATREHPCPTGQHIEGNYDRGYACISDAETSALQTKSTSGVSVEPWKTRP
jgi:hypothetical protein